MRKSLGARSLLIALLALFLSLPAMAGPTFFDINFNRSDYGPLLTYVTDPGMGSSVQQANFGNPGTSMQFTLTFPGAGDYEGYQGLLHNGWFYDPGTQGSLTKIGFDEDKYIHQNGSITLTGSNIRLLMLQGGNYYIAAIPVTAAFDEWESGGGFLTAADFAFFDFTTGIYDDQVHPDFSSGIMQFGIANYYGLSLDGNLQLDTYYDNLGISLYATPEPGSLLLLGSGLAGMAGWVRRKI